LARQAGRAGEAGAGGPAELGPAILARERRRQEREQDERRQPFHHPSPPAAPAGADSILGVGQHRLRALDPARSCRVPASDGARRNGPSSPGSYCIYGVTASVPTIVGWYVQ